jgi:outer membrane protein OmpA-like peptidoglycan-associated protein
VTLRIERFGLAGVLICTSAFCQSNIAPGAAPPAPMAERTVPLYTVTVVEHSLQAVNYEYRSSIPTEIDFRGTVLLPNSKGHATVESKRGRTEIDAHLDKLSPPAPFGRQYLTYVLWAISPEGAPHNLGEIVPNGNDSAHVHVTTDLQAFGLLVTAEPYSAVRQPSDVVVMENQVRPDTIGRIQPIIAKAELLSRGHFVYDKQAAMSEVAVDMPKVSMDEYEQLLEIYQAENALGIARVANAEQLAPDTFAKAVHAYDEARRLKSVKAGVSLVVQSAREAAQTADDARMIATQRALDNRVADAERQASTAQDEIARARREAQQARAEADAAKAEAESERIARQRAESEAAETPRSNENLPIAPPPPPVNAAPAPRALPPQASNRDANNPQQSDSRMRLLQMLNRVTATRDTPRGLVVTIPDAGFENGSLRPGGASAVAQVAAVMQPGLRISVEGYSDSMAGASVAQERAAAVRDTLLHRGVNAGMVTTRNFGDERPITSNASPGGRVENRRVEIVISGEAIGPRPLWDRSYDVTLR